MRQLFISAAVVLCLRSTVSAWPPWQKRPIFFHADFPDSEECVSFSRRTIGCVADYAATLDRPVPIASIGVSVRDSWAHINGSAVRGAEVIEVMPTGPAAQAGIRAASMLVKYAILETGAVFAIAVLPLIPIFQAIDHSSLLDHSDLIFAADGERIRNSIDFAARAEKLLPGGRIYLTVLRGWPTTSTLCDVTCCLLIHLDLAPRQG
jgi:S1-C subfamily serine protease